jgi:hypothetical protein
MSPEQYATGLALKLAAQQPDPRAALRKWGFDVALLENSAAYDSALPRRDQDPDDPDVMDRVMQFLQTRLDPGDFADLCELIGVEPPPPVEDPEPDDQHVAREAQDHPPPFRGRPRAGGAMDAAARSFAKRFPNAARIGVDNAGITSDPRRRQDYKRQQRLDAARYAHDDAGTRAARPVSDFNTRYPAAARIGHV